MPGYSNATRSRPPSIGNSPPRMPASNLDDFTHQSMLDTVLVQNRIEQRESNFLRMVERGIFLNPHSPYLPLLKLAGCSLGDIQDTVRTLGLEKTLRQLR